MNRLTYLAMTIMALLPFGNAKAQQVAPTTAKSTWSSVSLSATALTFSTTPNTWASAPRDTSLLPSSK